MPLNSISDVLDDLNIEVSQVAGAEISAHCPFHEDSHPSFSMNEKTGLWICYQCGARGSLPILLRLIAGDDIDADQYLKEVRFNAAAAEALPKRGKKKGDTPIDPRIIEARYESFREPPDWALENKKLDRETARRYGLRWDKGWVIPIWDPLETDRLWGWQFKRMDLVLNYPRTIKKSHTLFGLRELVSKRAALVESPLDVVRMAVVNAPAVASFGAFVSRQQRQLLYENLWEIWIALDADVEGRRQAQAIYTGLNKQVPTLMTMFPKGIKDPGDMSDDQVRRVFSDLYR